MVLLFDEMVQSYIMKYLYKNLNQYQFQYLQWCLFIFIQQSVIYCA